MAIRKPFRIRCHPRAMTMTWKVLECMVLSTATICAAMNSAGAQTSSPTPTTAESFQIDATRAHAALARDGGQLWGARLDSVAWLGVEGKTILLTAAPSVAGYTRSDGLWEGPLPTTVTPSNTSVNWGGRTWAMIMLPLPPGDSLMVERLFIHEAMHVLQPSVLPATEYSETGSGAAALDEPVGRSWLRLEWKALSAALRASGASRDRAVLDALLFRAERYAYVSTDEVTRERALDVKEGIPEYTGCKLSGSPRAEFEESIDSAPAKIPSFIRAFVYYTGPAYAMLLDDYTNGTWRRSLRTNPDLQSMTADALASRDLPDMPLIRTGLAAALQPAQVALLASAANQRAQLYGGAAIVAEENERWVARQRQLAEYRTKFVDGPVVMLRPHSLNISFDPRGQASLGASGTVMANLAWKSADGTTLTAPAGALVNQSWTELRVPLGNVQLSPGTVTAPTTIRGDGWTLVLEPGWIISTDKSSVVVSPPLKQ